MKIGNSRNTMRLRNLYLNAIYGFVDKNYGKSWDAICKQFLQANNDSLNENHIAFNHLGEYYPEGIANNTRKALLNRKSAPLVEDLCEEFEELYSKYVEDWKDVYRTFKNLVAVAFREALTEEEMELVLPPSIINQLEAYDFVPLASATGLTPQRAAELKQQYSLAYEIDGFITLGNIL